VSSPWSRWFEALPPFEGLLAAGLRLPDQTTLSKGWAEGFADAALANAWRCVDDTFRVMRLHRFPTRQLRWFYERAVLTAVRREDGCLFLVLTQPELSQDVDAVLRSWLDAFEAGSNPGKGPGKPSTEPTTGKPSTEVKTDTRSV
jgi:hypothetical protein